MINIIAAVAENGVIGKDNDLPWYLPADLKRFKELTIGHTVIMGRKTHESIVQRLGKPLPNRHSIVLSRGLEASALEIAKDLAEALEMADSDEVFVIGGESVFSESLKVADRLYLTEVHAKIDGDVYFPKFDQSQWVEIERVKFKADEKNQYPFNFITLERKEQ